MSHVVVEQDQIRGTLKEPAYQEVEEGEDVEYTDFITFLPSFGDEQLLSLLEANEVQIETRPQTDISWWAILLYVLPILLLFSVGYLVLRQIRGQGGGGIFSALNMRKSGAENDLKQATQLARRMVLDWGMSPKLDHIALGGRSEQVFLGQEIAQRREYSETTAHEVDQEIKSILDQAYERAVDALQEHREALDRLVDMLLEEEEIPGKHVLELVGVEDDETL